MERIARLYTIEAQARDLDADSRKRLRQEHSLPELQSLQDWLQQTRLKTDPKSAITRAIDYCLKRWPALIRYTDSNDLPIDNNPVENSIRPIALGKKNWLFAGSERAGKRAAAQMLLNTAKLNGLDPAA